MNPAGAIFGLGVGTMRLASELSRKKPQAPKRYGPGIRQWHPDLTGEAAGANRAWQMEQPDRGHLEQAFADQQAMREQQLAQGSEEEFQRAVDAGYLQARQDAEQGIMRQMAGRRGGYDPASYRLALQGRADVNQDLAASLMAARANAKQSYLDHLSKIRAQDLAGGGLALGDVTQGGRFALGREDLARKYYEDMARQRYLSEALQQQKYAQQLSADTAAYGAQMAKEPQKQDPWDQYFRTIGMGMATSGMGGG